MWDLREPVDLIDGDKCWRIAVRACVRYLSVPYMRCTEFTDPVLFEYVQFERDPLPGPDGYAVYRRRQ